MHSATLSIARSVRRDSHARPANEPRGTDSCVQIQSRSSSRSSERAAGEAPPMQRIPLARRRADQRAYALSRARRARTAGAHGNPVTAPVETLAPAFAQALPSLDGQPATYSHEVNGEMLYELCAALVRMGLGTPELWAECGEDPAGLCTTLDREPDRRRDSRVCSNAMSNITWK